MQYPKKSLKNPSAATFKLKTLPSTNTLLSQKNKYHRYDTSLYHKTIFHLIPIHNNPQIFGRVQSDNQKFIDLFNNNSKLKSNDHSTKKLQMPSVGKVSKSNTNNKQKLNKAIIPYPINIRQELNKYSKAKEIINILQDETTMLVTAKKWIIFDIIKNQPIKGYKYKKTHDIASVSKIITFYATYTIIQKYYLNLDKFTLLVDQEDQNIKGTKIDVKKDNIVTLNDMLFALLLTSANNAATIIAKNMGHLIRKKRQGGYFSCFDVLAEEKQKNTNTFMELLNGCLQQIGLSTQTIINNPHGMINNFSSALDIAKITSECFKIPLFCKIVNTKQINISVTYINSQGQLKSNPIQIQNTNKLLWKDNGCTGGKTGCNSQGGQSLMACFQGRIVVVVLGSIGKQQKFMDCEKLLQWWKSKSQII